MSANDPKSELRCRGLVVETADATHLSAVAQHMAGATHLSAGATHGAALLSLNRSFDRGGYGVHS